MSVLTLDESPGGWAQALRQVPAGVMPQLVVGATLAKLRSFESLSGPDLVAFTEHTLLGLWSTLRELCSLEYPDGASIVVLQSVAALELTAETALARATLYAARAMVKAAVLEARGRTPAIRFNLLLVPGGAAPGPAVRAALEQIASSPFLTGSELAVGRAGAMTAQGVTGPAARAASALALDDRSAPTDLTGRVVLVTGGTSGIGLASARACGRLGAQVVVTGRDGRRGEDAALRLGSEGLAVEFIEADVTKDADWERLMSRVDAHFGRLDALVNNAGTCILQPFASLPLAVAREMLETNLLGTALGLHYAIPRIRAQGGGAIIAVSSVAALRPARGNSAYAGSKAAITGLHQALAPELAAGAAPLRLHVIFPGLIWGEGVTSNFGEAEAGAFRATILASTPLGRVGEPQDIASWVAWLVGPAARSAWGTELVVDGGLAFGAPSG